MIATLCAGVALIGAAYQLAAATLAGRALGGRAPVGGPAPAVSVLKPLHGAEPRLAANLASFAAQDYAGPVEIICGVQRADDRAIATVTSLRAADPRFALVIDRTRHGSNAKVGNLINMAPAARHDILVISDSDMAVAPDYLTRVTAALAEPGVGAVTLLYHGRGDAGAWSKLAAMGISHGFLPAVVTGLALRLAQPCLGSTIALTRDTLDRIGGFAAFADDLADDNAIGMAVRRLGMRVAVPAFSIAHGCSDAGFAALVRHELRWNVTIRRLDPAGFVGHGLVNPLPFALLALALGGGALPLVAALLARLALALRIDSLTRSRAAPYWWLPARDLLSFGLFLATFATRSVDWRGARLEIDGAGRIAGGSEA